jgi:Domain of unknown function (DUF222)
LGAWYCGLDLISPIWWGDVGSVCITESYMKYGFTVVNLSSNKCTIADMGSDGSVLDDIVLTGAEFIDAWAAHERHAARLALAGRRLEASGDWAHDGSVSMTAWLRHHCRMSNRDAAALVHRGRFLDKFPAIAQAACDGVLSAGQVNALRTVTKPAVEAVMATQQAEIVAIIAPLTVADSEQAAGLWRQRAEAVVDLPEPVEPDRELRTAHTTDGLVGRFVLDDFGARQFEQAIRTASTWDGSGDVRDGARRSADALVDVCAFFNANHDKPGTPRRRPHVELMTEADTLGTSPIAWTTDHVVLNGATTDTLLCDCVIHRVMRSGSVILDYGRATRSVPLDLFRAVAARDGGCRHPGCDRKVSWCDAHHIHYWRNMGPTDLDNLVLLCSRHHHHVHRLGLLLKLLPNGDLDITFPDGTTRISRPRGQPGGRSP